MPRFVRNLLLLSTLSLLLLPTGDARADHEGEMTATLNGTSPITCNPTPPIASLSHERCTGGALYSGVPFVSVSATRDVTGAAQRTATCLDVSPGGIPVSTRATTAAARGLLGPASLRVGTGTVVDPSGTGTGPCDVRLTGTYHRVGNVAVGRLVVDVQVNTGNAARDFAHWYCARFVASAVPIPNTNVIEVFVEIEGRQPCREGLFDDPNAEHGRELADDVIHG